MVCRQAKASILVPPVSVEDETTNLGSGKVALGMLLLFGILKATSNDAEAEGNLASVAFCKPGAADVVSLLFAPPLPVWHFFVWPSSVRDSKLVDHKPRLLCCRKPTSHFKIYFDFRMKLHHHVLIRLELTHQSL